MNYYKLFNFIFRARKQKQYARIGSDLAAIIRYNN